MSQKNFEDPYWMYPKITRNLRYKDAIILTLSLFAFCVAIYRLYWYVGVVNRLVSGVITLIGIFLILMVYRNVKGRKT